MHVLLWPALPAKVRLATATALLGVLAVAACSSAELSADVAVVEIPGFEEVGTSSDASSEDSAAPDVADVAEEDAETETVDAAEYPLPPAPVPAPLSVGVARVRMPVPLGIPVAGLLPSPAGGGGATSRYADQAPASTTIYTHPTLHAVALRAGETTLVLLRADLFGMTQDMRAAALWRIGNNSAADLYYSLVVAATGTRSGPGRLADLGHWSERTDTFSPEIYDSVIGAMASVALKAIADLEPARFGATTITTDALHDDVRCESPEELDGVMPILRFDRLSDGKTKAVVTMYAASGTVLSGDNRTLSRDLHGALELKIEEQFDSPVTALSFASWSGDMRAKIEPVPTTLDVPSAYNSLEDAGNRGAKLVVDALAGITMKDEIALDSRMVRIPLNQKKLVYTADEFPWPFGATFCGDGVEAACWGEGAPPGKAALTAACAPFSASSPAPQNTMVGLIRIGNFLFATLPGEPTTALAQRVMTTITEGAKAALGPDDKVFLLGNAQDYLGDDLPEDDWYRGGEAAARTFWGPKQGDYIADRAIDWALHTLVGKPLSWEPTWFPMPTDYDFSDWAFDPTGEATIVTNPKATYVSGEVVELVVNAGDPWLVAPVATLLEKKPAGWAAVQKKNGRPLDSTGYEFELSLTVTPSYAEAASPTERVFAWTIRFPTVRPATSTNPALGSGLYALKVTGNTTKDKASFAVVSTPFTVTLGP